MRWIVLEFGQWGWLVLPQFPFGPTAFDLAAAYAFGLARNHPFVDGNKRIALVPAFTFLELNG